MSAETDGGAADAPMADSKDGTEATVSSSTVASASSSVTSAHAQHQQNQLYWTTNLTASALTNSLTSVGNSCLDEQIERLKRCEYLREGEVKALCLRAREILVDESNVQRVDAPVTVRCCASVLSERTCVM